MARKRKETYTFQQLCDLSHSPIWAAYTCPVCNAEVGAVCHKSSGQRAPKAHVARSKKRLDLASYKVSYIWILTRLDRPSCKPSLTIHQYTCSMDGDPDGRYANKLAHIIARSKRKRWTKPVVAVRRDDKVPLVVTKMQEQLQVELMAKARIEAEGAAIQAERRRLQPSSAYSGKTLCQLESSFGPDPINPCADLAQVLHQISKRKEACQAELDSLHLQEQHAMAALDRFAKAESPNNQTPA